MDTGFYWHPVSLEHDTGPGHPERAGRLQRVVEHLSASGRLDELDVRAAEPADAAALLRVHTPSHVRAVEAACRRGGVADRGDTVVCPASWEAALRSVGGGLQATDAVLAGELRRAFVAARPPGHHAESGEVMGFCLFNNVAVAAAHLRAVHGLERVAIVDFDVHHGNGTQHAFEEDPSVYFVSLHQWPWYPGTGAARERGRGAGEGATLNCPMPAGADDRAYLAAFEDQVLPALEDFDPQFLLVSAGFDAHAADPLSSTRVSTEGYGTMTSLLVDLAERHCDGRLVALLEGGYDLDALAHAVAAHVDALR